MLKYCAYSIFVNGDVIALHVYSICNWLGLLQKEEESSKHLLKD